MRWTQQEALELCRIVESICPEFGCHVALTGGLLYKFGQRKDCDLLLYRIRQADHIDIEGLLSALKDVGFTHTGPTDRFVIKAEFRGKSVDVFMPEADDGDYDPAPE